MGRPLMRRALAELIGTAFLVGAVVGSGIAAVRLSPHDVGLQLLENSLATGTALAALILALQPVSAAFNPVVTLVERALGMIRTIDAVTLATHHRGGGGVLFAEAVATFGLLLVIFGTVRAGRADRVALAVGGYIVAAYWFTSSTSFANPAVTVARSLSNTFAGIAPASVSGFVGMQLAGGLAALLVVRILFVTEPSRA
jgi:glycerol uptake facilitator-like aquaporin